MIKILWLNTNIDWFISLFYKYKTFPIAIQIAVFLIGMSVFFSLISPLYLIFLRFNSDRKDVLEKFKPDILILCNKILFENYLNTEKEIFVEFKKNIYNNKLTISQENLIIEYLIEIKSNSKTISERYSLIIKSLHLQLNIRAKIKSSDSGKRMKGINELSFLSLDSEDVNLTRFAYSSNSHVKEEARLSHMNLCTIDPFRFFDEFEDVDITKWAEVKLMNSLIEKLRFNSLPNLGKWISYSHNNSLVVFLIKATVHFNQGKSIYVLYEKIKDKNNDIKAESIIALGHFKALEYEKEFKDMYPFQTSNCQSAIEQSIGLMQSNQSLEFLADAYKELNILERRKTLANVILNYGSEGKALFNKLKSNARNTEQELLVFKHLENDYIFYK